MIRGCANPQNPKTAIAIARFLIPTRPAYQAIKPHLSSEFLAFRSTYVLTPKPTLPYGQRNWGIWKFAPRHTRATGSRSCRNGIARLNYRHYDRAGLARLP